MWTQESKVTAEYTRYDFNKLCVYIYIHMCLYIYTGRSKEKGIKPRKFKSAVTSRRERGCIREGHTVPSRDWSFLFLKLVNGYSLDASFKNCTYAFYVHSFSSGMYFTKRREKKEGRQASSGGGGTCHQLQPSLGHSELANREMYTQPLGTQPD